MRQNPGYPWFWLTVCYHPFWMVTPSDVVMTIAAFLMTFSALLLIIYEAYGPKEKLPYVPKRARPPKSIWIKSMLKPLHISANFVASMITNLKVRRQSRSQGPRAAGPRRQKKQNSPTGSFSSRLHSCHDYDLGGQSIRDNVGTPI